MNYKMIAKFIGKILLVGAAFMLPAYGISLFRQEEVAARAFLVTILLTMLTGGVLVTFRRRRDWSASDSAGSYSVCSVHFRFSFPEQFRIM